MWHEARKQERRIRGLIVDYRRRAERRQDFYEKIQADPTQFMQVHGRRCKVYLDPNMAAVGDGAAIIVPWQGQADNLIDRFDVRAHLDYIPPVAKNLETDVELTQEERQCNYERYRILAQNDFLNISEEKFLHQLYLEEQYGANAAADTLQISQTKKKTQKAGAAIGYTYDDNIGEVNVSGPGVQSCNTEKDSESESDTDMDMDVSIDITKLDTIQAHELNTCGRNYGMLSNDFYSYLTKDADEADALRIAREEQREKILLGGRKSRRERKAQKERRIALRPFSPPSYAAKDENLNKSEESESRSPSPQDTSEKITYITSFGGDEELQPHSKISINLQKSKKTTATESNTNEGPSSSHSCSHTTYAEKVKENLQKLKHFNKNSKRDKRKAYESYSRSRSISRTRERRSRRSSRRSRSSSYSYYRHRDDRRRSRSLSSYQSRSHSRSKKCIRRSRSRIHRRYSSSTNTSCDTSSSNFSRHLSKYYDEKKRSKKYKSLHGSVHKHRSESTLTKRQVQKCRSPLSKHKLLGDLKTRSTNIQQNDISKFSAEKVESIIHKSPVTDIATEMVLEVAEPPPPPFKRYYGRKRDQNSSSTATDSDDEQRHSDKSDKCAKYLVETTKMESTIEKSNQTTVLLEDCDKLVGKFTTLPTIDSLHNIPSETKDISCGIGRVNLRERLKRKMQNLLNKQYRADKRAEIEKTEREKQQLLERQGEMRELALKLRKRQRQLRHRYGSAQSSVTDSGSMTDHTTSQRYSPLRKNEHIERHSHERNKYAKAWRRSSSFSSKYYKHSRSHSRSRFKHTKSRSNSRSRYSTSRYSKRRRSTSRYRYDRNSHQLSHSSRNERASGVVYSRFDRNRRSRSTSGHDRYRDRNRSRLLQRDRETCKTERIQYDERYNSSIKRDRYFQSKMSTEVKTVISNISNDSREDSRVVISAPPKLKKLVDY